MHSNRLNKFLDKAKEKHNNYYDYSKVVYNGSLEKVCIICPKHGEFLQTPQSHLRGKGCPKCANERRGKGLTKIEFVERANSVHDGKYDYSQTEYKNINSKITINCPIHGSFTQLAINHLNGQGCPKCAGRGLTQEEVIKGFIDRHGDKYDYSKVEFVGMSQKVCIICPTHGEFWQTPLKHLKGQGCKKCAYIENGKKKRLELGDFLTKAKIIHNNKYDYSQTDYNTSHNKIKIICPEHGEFEQLPYDHIWGHGCPICGNIYSNGEFEIYNFLCNKLGEEKIKLHDRTILNGKEIDIFIPSKNIGIEYNGLYWHSEINGKDRNYHLNKLNECNNKGINLIQIFEDEYIKNKDLVLKKIEHILNLQNGYPKVMARKCLIKEISKKESRDFLSANHIQGYSNSSISYGAFYCEKLMGVMCFTKTDKEDEWILNRFATNNDYICQGIGGKLFSYFLKQYNPKMVKSFADRRWTVTKDNNLYTKLGFNLTDILSPDYRYVNEKNPKERIHKFNFRKKIMSKKYGLDESLTEREMTKEMNFFKIWDCGLYKYQWFNSSCIECR